MKQPGFPTHVCRGGVGTQNELRAVSLPVSAPSAPFDFVTQCRAHPDLDPSGLEVFTFRACHTQIVHLPPSSGASDLAWSEGEWEWDPGDCSAVCSPGPWLVFGGLWRGYVGLQWSTPGELALVAASEGKSDGNGQWASRTLRSSAKRGSDSPTLAVLLSGHAWISGVGEPSGAPVGLLPGSAVLLQQGADVEWGAQCAHDMVVWALWSWDSRVPLTLKKQAAFPRDEQVLGRVKRDKSRIPGKGVWMALRAEGWWLTGGVTANPLPAKVLASLKESGLTVVAGAMEWACHVGSPQAYMRATAMDAAGSLLNQDREVHVLPTCPEENYRFLESVLPNPCPQPRALIMPEEKDKHWTLLSLARSSATRWDPLSPD